MNRKLFLTASILLMCTGCGRRSEPNPPTDAPAEQLYPIKQNGKWGYMNAQCKIVIPPRFDEADEFSEGLAWADQTFIDTTGKTVIDLAPLVQQQIGEDHQFSGGIVTLKDSGLHKGYIENIGPIGVGAQSRAGPSMHAIMNQQGKITELPYPLLQSFSGGLAAINLNGGTAMINTSGDVVIPPGTYWTIPECGGEGLCAVASSVDPNHHYGFIDTQGKPAIPPQFQRAHAFSEGLARVSVVINSHEFWGFIDKTGTSIIATEFDAADDFSDGMAAVKKDGNWGFIDRSGRTCVDFLYSEPPGRFHKGLARVQVNGKMAYLDKQGHYVWTATD